MKVNSHFSARRDPRRVLSCPGAVQAGRGHKLEVLGNTYFRQKNDVSSRLRYIIILKSTI